MHSPAPTNPSTPPPRSKRGAPPGNTNALKHGFYARKFERADLNDLDSHQFSGLQDEIILLRVFIRRVIELSKDLEDLPEAVSLLRVLSLASISLTRLLRTQKLLAGDELGDIAAILSEALTEVNKDIEPF